MQLRQYDSRLANAQHLTRHLALACLVSVLTCGGLVIGSFSLLVRKQTVLLPPQLTSPVSFEAGRYSEEYLGQMARFFASIALNYTPASYEYQMREFLRYADPGAYGALKLKLTEEGELLKRRGWSAAFFPSGVVVRGNAVAVKGIQRTYVGELLSGEKKAAWFVQFAVAPSGQIAITAFREAPYEAPFDAADRL